MRVLEITSCEQCPHLKVERHHTADSFEHVWKWTCEKARGGARLIGYEEDRDKPAVPKWCPLPVARGGD